MFLFHFAAPLPGFAGQRGGRSTTEAQQKHNAGRTGLDLVSSLQAFELDILLMDMGRMPCHGEGQ